MFIDGVRFSIVAIALVSPACSTGSSAINGGADLAQGVDMAPPLPPQPTLAQVVNNGGPVIASPHVVPVFFGTDPYQADIEAFLTAFATSDVWTATTAEYGVGALTIDPSILVTDPAPTRATKEDIASWIASMADGTHAGWPKASADLIFTIFYPSTSVIALTSTEESCGALYGFHYEGMLADSTPLTYAAIARCGKYNALTGVDSVTPVAAHEIIETAADPFGMSKPAFRFADDAHKAWEYFSDEIADWCTTGTPETAVQIGKYWAQRSWSNAAAAAFHDPCVPAPAHPYVLAAPALDDIQLTTAGGGTLATKGLVIPVGSSRTLDVGIYGDGAVDGVSVRASSRYKVDYSLSFSWDRTSGSVGDVLKLTVSAPKAVTPDGQVRFVIWAKIGGAENGFPISVINGP